MFDHVLGVLVFKCQTSHICDFLAGETIAQVVVHKEVVQLVWSYFVFGYLCNISIFIGWQ